MIIWISGAYGVGKSTVAEALKKKMNNAYLSAVGLDEYEIEQIKEKLM